MFDAINKRYFVSYILMQPRKTSVLFGIDWWPESTQGNKWLTHMVMFTQSTGDPAKSTFNGEECVGSTLFVRCTKLEKLGQLSLT